MKTDPNRDDCLDELLAQQPLKLSADFTEQTLAAMKVDDPAELWIDAQLAFQPVEPSGRFVSQVMETIAAESDSKVLGFPTWTVTLGGIAALFVAGIVAFAALFQKADNDLGERMSQQVAALPVTPESQIQTYAAGVMADELLVEAELSDWEELILMQQELKQLSGLTDAQQRDTFAMLVH